MSSSSESRSSRDRCTHPATNFPFIFGASFPCAEYRSPSCESDSPQDLIPHFLFVLFDGCTLMMCGVAQIMATQEKGGSQRTASPNCSLCYPLSVFSHLHFCVCSSTKVTRALAPGHLLNDVVHHPSLLVIVVTENLVIVCPHHTTEKTVVSFSSDISFRLPTVRFGQFFPTALGPQPLHAKYALSSETESHSSRNKPIPYVLHLPNKLPQSVRVPPSMSTKIETPQKAWPRQALCGG